MDTERANYLVSPSGREALASIPPGWEALPVNTLATRLRSQLPPGEAAAIGEQISLRQQAGERLWSRDALLSAEGLQMATHPAVAERRAARLAGYGLRVADVTAGLGSDLSACIQAGADAVGIEHDRATAILAAANTSGRVVCADALSAPVRLANMALIVDPSRRDGSGRRFDPAAFSPPWDRAIALAQSASAAVVKGPPGISSAHIPPEAETEFVQVGRTLREAALWFGADSRPGLRRAVLLPAGATLTSDDPEGPGATAAAPGVYVFDPESCVTRAGLVRHLGARIRARLLDPQVAYLTGAEPSADPLCATFEVLDVVPFSIGRLKSRLRACGWRAVEIRRRAFPIEPDELRKLLGRQDGDEVALLCTTIARRRTVIIGRRVARKEETVNRCRQ